MDDKQTCPDLEGRISFLEQALKEKDHIIREITTNLEVFFNTIDDFLFVLDEQGNILHCNKTVEKRLKYTLKELKGQSILNLHPEERRSEAAQIVSEMIQGKTVFCPIPLVTKQGKQILVETRFVSGVWNGKPVLFGVSKDISRLKLSEEKFSSVFYLNQSACGLSDANTGQYIEVNDAFVQLFGYTREEAIGRTASELHILSDEVRAEILSKADSMGRVYNAETTLQTKNGDTRNVILSAQNLVVQDVVYRYTIVHDVTELYKAKERAEESEEEFRNLYDSLPIAYLIMKDDIFIECNKAALTLFGVESKEEVVGKKAADFSPAYQANQKKSSEAAFEEIQMAIEKGYHTFDWKSMRKNMEVFDSEVSLKKFFYKNEWCMLSLVTDVTERKRVEAELIAAKEGAEINDIRFRQLAENVNEIIWFRVDKKVQYVNPAFEKTYGITKEQMYDDSKALLRVIHPDDVEKFKNAAGSDDLSNKGLFSCEYRIINPDHEIRWIDSRSNRIKDDQSNYGSWVGIAIDVTENKKYENELIRAKEKAEESDRLKTAFLQNMSHEIRTPLNSICGFSGFLGEEDVSPEKRDSYVQIIQNSSNQLLSIVSNILTISSLETKQETIHLSEVCINDIIVEQLAIIKQQAKNQNISLFAKQPLTDRQSEIYTDKTKVTQVLSNLLSNAMKFTHFGSVEFGYRLINGEMEFYVKDSGIGIKTEYHEVIFERFRQADKSIQANYGGTGLGLSICKGFVELLGGRIWVESEVGKGASFYFTLPYNPVNETDKVMSPNNQNENAITVLVAEDDDFNFLYMEEVLKQLNLKIIHAKNGREAIELLKSNPQVDLIFMDIKMPVMNGYDAAKIIKSIRPDLPVVAQSAYAMESERAKYSEVFDDYLSKPLRIGIISETINKYIAINL